MGRFLWVWRLYSPWFLLVYYWFWRTLFRFCQWGGVRRRTPVLAGCMALFFLYFLLFLWEKAFIPEKQPGRRDQKAEIEGNTLCLSDGTRIDLRQVRKVRRKEEQVWIFLKEHRFLWLDMTEWPRRNRICLDLS